MAKYDDDELMDELMLDVWDGLKEEPSIPKKSYPAKKKKSEKKKEAKTKKQYRIHYRFDGLDLSEVQKAYTADQAVTVFCKLSNSWYIKKEVKNKTRGFWVEEIKKEEKIMANDEKKMVNKDIMEAVEAANEQAQEQQQKVQQQQTAQKEPMNNEEEKKMMNEKKNVVEEAVETALNLDENDNNTVVIGYDKYRGFIKTAKFVPTPTEVVEVTFNDKTYILKASKGLDCSKVYTGEKEFAYIVWGKGKFSPSVRLLTAKDPNKKYLMGYDGKFFTWGEDKARIFVNEAQQEWLNGFFSTFIAKVAVIKGYKMPEKKDTAADRQAALDAEWADPAYQASLEAEMAQEAARIAAWQAKKDQK